MCKRRDRFVQFLALGDQAAAQFAAKSARRRDAQLASVRPGAGGDVHDAARAWLAEVDGFQIGEKRRHVGLADPADEEILLDRGSNRAAGVTGDYVRQRAKLVRGDVAQREGDRGGDIAGLTLVADIGLDPPLEAFVAVQRRKIPPAA